MLDQPPQVVVVGKPLPTPATYSKMEHQWTTDLYLLSEAILILFGRQTTLNTYDQNASKCSASFRNISQFIGFNWYVSTFQSPTSRTCLTSQPSLTSVTSLCRRTGRCTREDLNRRSALAGHVGSIWKVKGLSFKP